MTWTNEDLKTELAAPAYATLSDAAALALVQQVTIPGPADTTGTAVKGALYARGSWSRVRLFAQQGLTGDAAHDSVWAIAQTLVEQANNDEAMPITSAPIAEQVQRDMIALAAFKLPDGKGVIWASGELTADDAGDAAVLIASLGTASVPKFPGVTQRDVWIARGQPE